jgi:hypothetical protein
MMNRIDLKLSIINTIQSVLVKILGRKSLTTNSSDA